MKKCLLSLILAVSVYTAVYSLPKAKRGSAELAECGHWIYDSLAKVSIESGRADFSYSAPLSLAEIRLYLEEADYDSLSAAGKAEYDRVIAYIEDENPAFNASIFALTAEPEVNVEGYYKQNDDLDFVYDRYSRKDLIKIPVGFQAQDLFTMKMDVSLRENKGMSLHNDNYSNIFVSPDEIDVNFPDNAYFSTGCMIAEDAGVNFRIGTGTQSVGRTLTGSLIQSEYMTGATYTNLEFYTHNFRYNLNVNQLNVDRYMYTHRLEARFFKKVTLTAQESVLINAPFELRFVNPLTIYHGMSSWTNYDADDDETHVCSYFGLKLDVVPCRYIRFYGLFAMTQYQTPYELENWPNDVTPNGLGFQFGAESYVPYRDGYFHTWLEGYIADPYMYIKESPNWTLVRTYKENIGDMAVFYEWAGSPLGPDTIAGQLSFGYEKKNWSLSADYQFMARGEYSGTKVFDSLKWGGNDFGFDYKGDENAEDLKDWCYPDNGGQGKEEAKRRQKLTCPSGTPEYVNRITLKGTYRLNEAFSFTLQPSYVVIFNRNNVSDKKETGFEAAVSASIKIKELLK